MATTSPQTTSNPSPQHIGRGKTCLNCRRRKIKCDGKRPMCGPCGRSHGSFEDCEYFDGQPTQVELLEDKIHQVQSRISELESPGYTPSLTLRDPYHLDSPYQLHSEDLTSSVLSRVAPSHQVMSILDTPMSPSYNEAPAGYLEEPPANVRSLLLDTFYSHCHRYGFFLHLDRFYESVLLPVPLGCFSRPSPALLSVVYLWGFHLTPLYQGIHDKELFLHSSLHYLAQDLSSYHPHKVMHTIQAEVLLSYYYLDNGKLLEANYHVNAAVSLSFSAGLHHSHSLNFNSIGSNSPQSWSLPDLPPPEDILEEGERINAFWAVLVLNCYWVAIQESQTMSFNLLDADIDTPWPTDSIGYQLQSLPEEGGGTVRRFIECRSVDGISIKALHAKAVILLEQVISLQGYGKEYSPQSKSFLNLDSLIDKLQTVSPLNGGLETSTSNREIMTLTQMVMHTCTIKLHSPFCGDSAESRNKCLTAARSIANLTEDMIPADSQQPYIDPILGVLWTSACEILMSQVLSDNTESPESAHFLVSLETINSRITRFSESNNLIKYLVAQFQRRYSTRFMVHQ